MDDLISRKSAIKITEKYGLSKGTTIGKHSGIAEIISDKLSELPSVHAVPLDDLCEWLERYATMDCDGCREAFGSCEDTEPSVCNSRERWKAMLTTWMEGLDAAD